MSDTRLNTLKAPAKKAARRVGRGIGSNYGKTSGRGHKGQRARAGARRDGVFEGGQMPLHRRVPKRGFSSRLARRTMQLRLSDIERLKVDSVDMEVLREKSVLSNGITRARIFNQGAITRAVVVSGIPVSKGAKQAIEAAGGKIVSN